MTWQAFTVAQEATHHVGADGEPAYLERFDEVLKFHEPGLAPVRRDACAWHIWADGSPAYGSRFERTFGFYEGLAAVSEVGSWHHITPDGREAYGQRYAWCGNFQGGMCAVREVDGTYLHIASNGYPAYAERWRYAGDFRDGVGVVQAPDGRSTHIDSSGRQLHGHWFIDLDVFHKGFARARSRDGWMHVAVDGVPAYERRFASVEPFYNGQARVERFDGALEVINEAGKMLVELRPPLRSEFSALSADLVGFWRTQTISVAVQLGLFEALPGTSESIATGCGLSNHGTTRLLRALAELSLVKRTEGAWSATARGEYLRRAHPMTLADAALEYAGAFSRLWEALPSALSDKTKWRAADIFEIVAKDAERVEGHHRMLRSYALHDYPLVIDALGLHGHEHIVDAAGGLGVMACLILATHPAAQVTVIDRAEVVALGRRQAEQPPGLSWAECDIMQPWGLQADAVLLSRVLHDWADEQALRILKRARAVLPIGGRVVIVEMLLSEHDFNGGLCDLHLLMATGGGERTSQEYGDLLNQAGFELAAVRSTAALPAVLVGIAK